MRCTLKNYLLNEYLSTWQLGEKCTLRLRKKAAIYFKIKSWLMSRTMVDIESNKTCISIGSPPESPISLKSSCVITFIPLYNAPSSVEKFTWPENRSESLSWHLFVSFFAMDGKEFVTNIRFQRFIKNDKTYSTDWFQKPPQSLPLSFYLYGLCKTN